jgi:hypothetical protein
LTAEVSAKRVLVAAFFLYVTVLNPPGAGNSADPEGEIPVAVTSLYDNPSRAGSTVDPEGEIPAAATSLYDNSVKVVPTGIGEAPVERVVRATRWDTSAGEKRCSLGML